MADTLKRSYVKRETAQARAYSQAVITEGGRTIWLAGQVAIEDAAGRSLAADFDGQVREVFARLGRTLEEAGASLADLVTMTVFITDARLGDRFTQLRREIFSDNFPASALITVSMQVTLTDRQGKVLFQNPSYLFHEEYELSRDLSSFFEEDSPAVDRLSRDFARTLVANILEAY